MSAEPQSELEPLNDEDYAVYVDRVRFCVDVIGMTLKDARAVARSEAPQDEMRRLKRKGCSPELIAKIVT